MAREKARRNSGARGRLFPIGDVVRAGLAKGYARRRAAPNLVEAITPLQLRDQVVGLVISIRGEAGDETLELCGPGYIQHGTSADDGQVSTGPQACGYLGQNDAPVHPVKALCSNDERILAGEGELLRRRT